MTLALEAAQGRAPGGVEVGPGRKAAGELEVDQSVREGPQSPGEVFVPTGGGNERGGCGRLDSWRQAISFQRVSGRQLVELGVGPGPGPVGLSERADARACGLEVRRQTK